MKLYIAGGCGEHGRNCFLVEGSNVRFLVDCGIMAGEQGGGYPHLTKESILSLDYVFLTHSHLDHTGALQWLFSNGYKGPVIATSETLRQCAYNFPIYYPLEKICQGGSGIVQKLALSWGRSGHCEGSVWYKISTGGKSILFSGDYTENTILYRCDKIRGIVADFAVLDCAYGNDTVSYKEYCNKLLENIKILLSKHKLLLFPVPKYGRGTELIRLFSDNLPNTGFFGDSFFVNYINSLCNKEFWLQSVDRPPLNAMQYNGQKEGIVFVSDPQLRTNTAQETAEFVLSNGGRAVMTGTVEENSYSRELLKSGIADECRYPVHLNRSGFELLINKNYFKKTIAYHSSDISVHSPIDF